MDAILKTTLISKINQSTWWHVLPRDMEAYKKRGKFLASTYRQAGFYGRPNNIPDRVEIKNPVYGFSEKEILMQLFPHDWKNLMLNNEANYNDRIALDARMYCKARALGYDAIVLIDHNGKDALKRNRKPYSIELNLLYPKS